MPSAYYLSYHIAQLPDLIIFTSVLFSVLLIFVKGTDSYSLVKLLANWFLIFFKLIAVLTMTII